MAKNLTLAKRDVSPIVLQSVFMRSWSMRGTEWRPFAACVLYDDYSGGH